MVKEANFGEVYFDVKVKNPVYFKKDGGVRQRYDVTHRGIVKSNIGSSAFSKDELDRLIPFRNIEFAINTGTDCVQWKNRNKTNRARTCVE